MQSLMKHSRQKICSLLRCFWLNLPEHLMNNSKLQNTDLAVIFTSLFRYHDRSGLHFFLIK